MTNAERIADIQATLDRIAVKLATPAPRRYTLEDARKPIDPTLAAIRERVQMSGKMSRLRAHNR